jgi:hypothetical protein
LAVVRNSEKMLKYLSWGKAQAGIHTRLEITLKIHKLHYCVFMISSRGVEVVEKWRGNAEAPRACRKVLSAQLGFDEGDNEKRADDSSRRS